MKSSISEETVSIRLPKGSAAMLRMLTGQPFSTLMRGMVLNMIDKYKAEAEERQRAASSSS